MSSGKIWFFLCMFLVFVAGALAGALVDRKFGGANPQAVQKLAPREAPKAEPPAPGPEEEKLADGRFLEGKSLSELYIQNLVDEVELTPEQEVRVREILADNEDEFITLRKQVQQIYSGLIESVQADIKTALTDKQKIKFDVWMLRRLGRKNKSETQ